MVRVQVSGEKLVKKKPSEIILWSMILSFNYRRLVLYTGSNRRSIAFATFGSLAQGRGRRRQVSNCCAQDSCSIFNFLLNRDIRCLSPLTLSFCCWRNVFFKLWNVTVLKTFCHSIIDITSEYTMSRSIQNVTIVVKMLFLTSWPGMRCYATHSPPPPLSAFYFLAIGWMA